MPSRLSILIVEDNEDGAESLAMLLGLFGHETCVAMTGEAALATVGEFTPDVVILDIGLPALDGYAVTHTLKASARPPVVVFLIVHGDPLSRQRAREAGSDGFAEKGAGWRALIAEVRRVLRARGS